MKLGSGCRIGAVAVSKVILTNTPAGIGIDVHYQLIDPETKAVMAVSRMTRDWPPNFKEDLDKFVEAVETALAQRVFTSSEGATSLSIADHLEQYVEEKAAEAEGEEL